MLGNFHIIFLDGPMRYSFENTLDKYLNPRLVVALPKAWSRETCDPQYLERYTTKNPAWGQATVTALVAWASESFIDHLQLSLVQPNVYPPCRPLRHFHLVRTRPLYEYDIDPTGQQFPEGSPSEGVYRYGQASALHHHILYECLFEPMARVELKQRLALFIDRLENQGGYRLPSSTGEIFAQLDKKFEYVHRWARENGLALTEEPLSQAALIAPEPVLP